MNEQIHDEQPIGGATTPGDDHWDGNGTTGQVDTAPADVAGSTPPSGGNGEEGDPPVQLIPPADIKLDKDVQSRVAINAGAIEEFAESMNDGASFPPVIVCYDGDTYWCADGFHRVKAARKAGKAAIAAKVYEGGKDDALLRSVGANVAHGIRRTNKDKRRAVTILLRHEVWGKWGVREIARRAGVTHPTVTAVKKELEQPDQGGKTYHPDSTPKEQPTEETPPQTADTGEHADGDAEQPEQHSEATGKEGSEDAPTENDSPKDPREDAPADEQSKSLPQEPEESTSDQVNLAAYDPRAAVDQLVEATSEAIALVEEQVTQGHAAQKDAVETIDYASKRMLVVFSNARIRIRETGTKTKAEAKTVDC
jgi:hypothetical protein